ncbi:slit homolog 1 protein-like [Haliotis rufescens]|uniref:slit homolog 1 protein-like n=1 Tax=Haliotis rufescens TaxID=6454 RepID=UPI00201F5F4B|nr:slit homolog 1 protein-like [Haliotis rufescens]
MLVQGPNQTSPSKYDSIMIIHKDIILLKANRGTPYWPTCPTGCSCSTTTINCNRINSLPSFSSPSVTRIQIDNINSSIHFNAFKAVPKLESIFIRNGNISFIATCAFGEIPAKSIGIVNVRIGVIGLGAFKDLHNVGRSISIHNCQIGQISSNAFYRLSNITLLSLNTNNISTIQTYAFNKITSGTSLNVFHNNITTINSYAFNFGPNVFSTYAFMTGGSIMNIGCQALKGLRTITYPTLRCDCDLVPLVQSPIYLGRVNCFSQSQLHDVISGSINDCTKPTLREPGYCVF